MKNCFALRFSTLFLSLLLLSSCNNEESLTYNDSIRVVTLAPHLAELVVEAGGINNIVGVTSYSDFPESLKHVDTIGDAFKIDFETILSLKPNYIFSWKNGTPVSISSKLKQLNLNVVEIEISNLSDIPKSILKISKLLKTESIAQKQVDYFNQELQSIRSNKHSRYNAFIQLSIKPIYTVAANHWMSEAVALCGYDNIYSKLNNISVPISLESVLAKNPDVIININKKADTKWNQWTQLKAVKNNKIINVSADYFSRPTSRILIGIKQLCQSNKAINP